MFGRKKAQSNVDVTEIGGTSAQRKPGIDLDKQIQDFSGDVDFQ